MKIESGKSIPWCPLLKDFCLLTECMWFDDLYNDKTCVMVRIAEHLEGLGAVKDRNY